MKKLQSNFTTPEQSKRLLELGVPADSADLAYSAVYFKNFDESGSRSGWKPTPSFNYIAIPDWSKHTHYPCWSVGRLIEIAILCTQHYTGSDVVQFQMECLNYGLIKCLIALLQLSKNDGDLDFSKLEE